MISRTPELDKFERDRALREASEPLHKRLRIVEELVALMRQAGTLGRWTEGPDLEAKIRYARAINLRKRSQPGRQSA